VKHLRISDISGEIRTEHIPNFRRMETETVQHIICCCEVLVRQSYNVCGKLSAEAEDTGTVSVRDLYLFIRGTGLLGLC
jgi:hypothetical protein